MNKLDIKEVNFVENIEYFDFDKNTYFDFYIDGQALSEMLNILRFTLRYCSFGFDIFDHSQNSVSKSANLKRIKYKLSEFLGLQKPDTQFETEMVVLYGCHCGCHYCGVISFELFIEKDQVIWKNIGYEEDKRSDYESDLLIEQDTEKELGIKKIEQLIFDKKEYFKMFQMYEENYLKSFI